MTPAPTYTRGGAVFYAPGVMEATCRYRELDMEGYVGYVALMSPADLGKSVWIKGPQGWEGPFLVCDCGVRGQVWEMVMIRGELIEVDWRTARRWGMGPFTGGWKIQVEVHVGGDPRAWGRYAPGWYPTDYRQWFEDNFELDHQCVYEAKPGWWVWCP